MKSQRLLALCLTAAMLTGCGGPEPEETSAQTAPSSAPTVQASEPAAAAETWEQPDISTQYVSRFTEETAIVLSDRGISVNGGGETDSVYTSHDIIYYEDRDTYDSGNPYGEGEAADRHSAEEAAAHTVVNITAPGAYRVSGSLTAGQIRVDLGQEAEVMGQRPSEGFNGERPEGVQEPPEGFDGERPEDGQEPPEGFDGEKPEDSREPPKI